jgi:hypothetical protein
MVVGIDEHLKPALPGSEGGKLPLDKFIEIRYIIIDKQ